ncbi:MAG: hypothetical protein RL026_2840 [Pseudomonadota bacterium]|jgi:oligopeptidase B
MPTSPPRADVRLHEVPSPHGTRIDPYYWLRDDSRKDPAVLAYLQAENAWREAAMAPVRQLEDTLFKEMVSRIAPDDSSVPAPRGAWDYWVRYSEGQEHPVYLRRPRGKADHPGEVLLDVNQSATGQSFFQVGATESSADGQLFGWAEDAVGRRQWVLRFRDLRTGELLADRIPNAEAGFAFANDGRTLFYVAKDPQTLLGDRVMRHVLGTPVETDEEVFRNDDDSFYLRLGKSRSERFVVLMLDSTETTEVLWLDAAQPSGRFQVVLPREDGHEYQVEDLGADLVLRSNWQAPNFRIVRVPAAHVADRSRWQDVIAHRDDAFVEDFEVFERFLAVQERGNALARLRVRRWDGSLDQYVAADEPAYVMDLGSNEDPALDVLRYVYASPATPATTYELDLRSGERRQLKRQQVPGGFNPADHVVELRWAAARDGEHIPVTLVRHRDTPLDGSAPLYQYAYGAYGYSSDASFSIGRLSLLQRGFVWAIAHVRGGQEMGRRWYDAGRLHAKQNSFSDFADVTHYLVSSKVCAPDKVFGAGGSAGGLLIGAVANQAPQRYRGLVAHVPFVDVVTTMLDESIPLTTNEYDEWGNPAHKAFHDTMLAYSPYDNVRAQDYPAMLVTSGLWDSQVQYWEPAKWVAKLRATKTDARPLLLHTDMEAGHGGKSGRFQRHRDHAMEFAWILQQLGYAGK